MFHFRSLAHLQNCFYSGQYSNYGIRYVYFSSISRAPSIMYNDSFMESQQYYHNTLKPFGAVTWV